MIKLGYVLDTFFQGPFIVIRLGYIMTLKRHVDDVESTSYAVNFKSSYFFPLHCKSDFAETDIVFTKPL